MLERLEQLHVGARGLDGDHVASGRGIAALPRGLVEEYADDLDVVTVRLGRLGRRGIAKQIIVGVREADRQIDSLRGFIAQARQHPRSPSRKRKP